MIALSDNSATNAVIDAVGGPEAVNDTMRRVGCPTVRLNRRVQFAAGVEGPLGEASASDLCRLVWLVARRELLGPDVSLAVEQLLGRQQQLDQVARYLRFNPYFRELGEDPPLTIASKPGLLPGLRTDVGIVRWAGDGGLVYAVMNHGCRDTTFLPEAEGSIINGLVGKRLVEHWWPETLGPVPTVDTPHDYETREPG